MVVCVQIMEREDGNCFGPTVSALEFEGAVLEAVHWLALFPGTAVATHAFHVH